MPRIPTHVSQQGVEGAIGVQPTLDPAAVAAPYQALAQAGQQGQGGALKLFDVWAYRAAQERKTAAKYELDERMNDLKLAFADVELGTASAGVPAVEYVPTIVKGLDKARSEIGKTFRYPEAQAAFQAQSSDLRTAHVIAGAKEGARRENAENEVAEGLETQRQATVAVFATTEEEKQGAFNKVIGDLKMMVRNGTYDGPKAAGKFTGFLHEVGKGTVLRRFLDPAQRLSVVRELMTGGAPFLGADESLVLGHTLMERMLSENREAEKAAREVFADLKHDASSALVQQYQDGEIGGTLALEKLRGLRAEYRMDVPEYERIRAILTEPPKTAPSDPATLNRVIQGVNRMTPTMGEAQLDRLHGAGLLNTKDWREALNHLAAVSRSNRSEARSVLGASQGQAEQEIKAALKIPPFYTKLDDVQDQLYSQALRELSTRSAFFKEGGGEDPLLIAREMIPRLRSGLGEKSLDNADALKKLTKFGTVEELQAWYAGDPKKRAEYDVQLRYLRQIRDAENLADQQRAQRDFERKGTSGRRQ